MTIPFGRSIASSLVPSITRPREASIPPGKMPYELPPNQVSNVAKKDLKDVNDDFTNNSNAFMSWLVSQPGVIIDPSIKIADYRSRNAGRGIEAVDDISADTELFSIPRDVILSVSNSELPGKLPDVVFNCHDSHDSDDEDENDDDTIKTSDEQFRLNPWTSLILVLIYESLQQSNSRWKPYMDILPTHFDTLMFWSEKELKRLQGCAVVNKIGRESADDEFRKTILPIMRRYRDVFWPSHDSNGQHANENAQDLNFDNDDVLLSLSHRMGSTIMAYAFDIEKERSLNGQTQAEETHSVDENGYMTDSSAEDEQDINTLPKGMVPLADILNADYPPNASLFYGSETLSMKSLRVISKGEEILNDYGAVPRSDLLRRYGYITENYESFDCVEITLESILESVREFMKSEVAEGEAGVEDEGDLNKRLGFLERHEVLEDSFDLVWPLQRPLHSGTGETPITKTADPLSYTSPSLSTTLRTLLIDRQYYKLPVTDPLMVEIPNDRLKKVMKPVLERRLEEYTVGVGADDLKEEDVNGEKGNEDEDVDEEREKGEEENEGRNERLRMAREVKGGEMRLLRAVLRSFDGLEMEDDDDGQSKSNKKRKIA